MNLKERAQLSVSRPIAASATNIPATRQTLERLATLVEPTPRESLPNGEYP